jgi:hypothetical protein
MHAQSYFHIAIFNKINISSKAFLANVTNRRENGTECGNRAAVRDRWRYGSYWNIYCRYTGLPVADNDRVNITIG